MITVCSWIAYKSLALSNTCLYKGEIPLTKNATHKITSSKSNGF